MRSTLLALVAATALSGCVVYDDEPGADTAAPGARPGDRPGQDEPVVPGPLWLHPAGGLAGETLIVALVSDGGRDLRSIADLTLYGAEEHVMVLADAPRSADEHLLTIEIGPDAAGAEVHLLVEFADGTEEFLSDAFVIADDPALLPTTPAPPICDR